MRYGKRVVTKTIVLALAFAGIVLDARGESGQVLERGTNKPMAGVFVIAEWYGSIPNAVQSHSVCYHADIAVTDSEGRYNVASVSGNLNPFILTRRRALGAYLPGFRQAPIPLDPETRLIMEPRDGAKAEKFAAVLRESFGESCDGGDSKKFIAARKAKALELFALAETMDQFERVDSVLYGIDVIESGENVAEKNQRTRDAERAKAQTKGTTK